MTHSVQFTATTSCSDDTIIGYTIDVSDSAGTSLETFTLGSGAASTPGVTHAAPVVAGTLPIIDVDETAITQDVRVTFTSYETACGVAAVGEFTDVAMQDGANNTSGPLTGCAAVQGMKHFNTWRGQRAGHVETSNLTWIGQDNRLYGVGSNSASFGQLGWDNAARPSGTDFSDTDLNLVYNGMPGYTPVDVNSPIHFGNLEAYLPGVAIAKMRSSTVAGPYFVMTQDGRIFTWSHSTDAAASLGTAFDEYTTRTDLIQAATIQVPYEIEAPNGQPWKNFLLNGISFIGVTDDDTFYFAGFAQPSAIASGTVATPVSTSAQVDLRDLTEIAHWLHYPKVPDARNIDADPGDEMLYFPINAVQANGVMVDATGVVRVKNGALGLTLANGGIDSATRWGTMPIPTGAECVDLYVNTNAQYGIAADADGQLWFAGSYGGSVRFPAGNATGVVAQGTPTSTNGIWIPMDMSNVPAGVTFKKVIGGPILAIALGSDGKIYTMTEEQGPIALNWPNGTNQDVRNVWMSNNDEIIFTQNDGEVFIGRLRRPGASVSLADMVNWGSLQPTNEQLDLIGVSMSNLGLSELAAEFPIKASC